MGKCYTPLITKVQMLYSNTLVQIAYTHAHIHTYTYVHEMYLFCMKKFNWNGNSSNSYVCASGRIRAIKTTQICIMHTHTHIHTHIYVYVCLEVCLKYKLLQAVIEHPVSVVRSKLECSNIILFKLLILFFLTLPFALIV